MKQKMSKSWDMRFNWLRDRSVIQKILRIYWAKGTSNWADYFTKHHPTKYHRAIRARYVQDYRREQSDVKYYLPFPRLANHEGMLLRTCNHSGVMIS